MIFKTPAAEEDLINLWRYIAQDNPAAADRVHQSAEKTFESIADMPGIGTAYRSKRAKLHGLRFFPLTQYPNYVVYYREIDNGIEIVRVLHAHMEKERRLET
ncbi:MAG: type II toxin-antitoxin system RelE/ParE family toxin [Deltaproteobacteria bacterium]|nr:type II toxin-antitoxin system RelE/ParE family toxin [Deltaproteobacteria bacterium]